MKIKNLIQITCAVLMLIISLQTLHAQCEPDTVNCKDINMPGEICPLILPEGVVNQPYEKVFTVIPPNQAITQYGPIDIVKIVIDTVGNLPPGLNYSTNSDTFYVDTAYCVLLTGIPTTPGTYDLYIRVIPYIYSIIIGVFEGTPIVDDTSLTIVVRDASGIDDFSGKEFLILEASPNPFRNSTRIGFYSSNQYPVELKIYNLLGKLIYEEKTDGITGKKIFDFDGQSLQSGTYLYNISCNGTSVTKKIVKLE
jgi:hypothetical protein